jgi:CO/xanthine dehydrogenase Mo-binding subunit
MDSISTQTVERVLRRQGEPLKYSTDQPRIDARAKVSGASRYVEDMPDPPGTVYVAPILSPYSHARIVAIDASRAEQLPGVLAVLHARNLSSLGFAVAARHRDSYSLGPSEWARAQKAETGDTTDQHFITTDKARFDGDLIGVVAAVDLRTARRAAELVDVEYELLPPVFSPAEAFQPDAPLVHEGLGHNLAFEDSLEWGDVERGLAEAAHVFEESFLCSTVFHHPMEPAMSFIANFQGDTLEFWAPTNNPFDIVNEASALFEIPPDQVRVQVPAVGGNFGAKHVAPAMMPAAALSRKLGRPVKLVATAEESFRVTSRHAMLYKATVGVREDGLLVALAVDIDADTGAYFTGAGIATGNAVSSSFGGYRVPNFRCRARAAYTNKVPSAMFRNTGKNQTSFGLDCTMDAVAHRLGMDPIAFREKNLLRSGEMPVGMWARKGKEGQIDVPPLDTDFGELMRTAAQAIGWDGQPTAHPPADAEARVARGRGLAVSLRRGSHIGLAEAAASLERSGRVAISHNAPDVGEGAYTMISVVAANALGVPQSQVLVEDPDTSNALLYSGTSSQRTTVQMGGAVKNACDDLKRQIVEAAAQLRGGAPEDWALADGELRRGDERLTLAELAAALPGDPPLRGTGSFKATRTGNASFGAHDHWSPGVGAAEVEVDRETGEVRVLQYAAVADAGRILHHFSAKGQVDGGAVMGFGTALFEEIRYEEGQLQNADPFQYRLPLLRDIPERFHTLMIENGDGPGPFGAKGIAQVGIPNPAPAIANAIYDAVGVRLRSTPFTPEKILRALGKLDSGE